jgi:uncharacterized protein YbjQ (UPF0145 family)
MRDIQKSTGVFLLTVNRLDGYEIVEYYGLVSGHAIVGANFIKDFFARVADVTGGRVSGYERALDAASNGALTAMAQNARKLGANAVVGIDVNTGSVNGRMLQASAFGTAVEVRPLKDEREFPLP